MVKNITKVTDNGYSKINKQWVHKTHANIEFIGNIDELQAFIALFVMHTNNLDLYRYMQTISEDCYNIMLNVSHNNNTNFDKQIKIFDKYISDNSIQPNHIISPSLLCDEGVYLNVIRTIVRRTERSSYYIECDENIRTYLNRLSDYLFALLVNK